LIRNDIQIDNKSNGNKNKWPASYCSSIGPEVRGFDFYRLDSPGETLQLQNWYKKYRDEIEKSLPGLRVDWNSWSSFRSQNTPVRLSKKGL